MCPYWYSDMVQFFHKIALLHVVWTTPQKLTNFGDENFHIRVTIFPFVVDRVTYLIFAGENNHYGGISLDEKIKFTGRHSAANTIGKNNRLNTTQQNELICRLFYFITDNFVNFLYWP